MNNNRMDRILKACGWSYDNGWRHDSMGWDCYIDSGYGSPDGYFVILVMNGQGRVLKLKEDEKTEI